MKKLFVLCFALMMLFAACASAATLGPANAAYGDGGYICSLTAPNGQELYYVSAMPQADAMEEGMFAPEPIFEDVNFDGHDDIVMATCIGASNAFYTFFVWDGERYVMAQRDACLDTDLPNYELMPEQGLVVARGTNGFAGMLHDVYVFRWEGTALRLVRSAESDIRATMVQQGSRVLDYESDSDVIYGAVYDHTGDEPKLLWEGTVDVMNDSEDAQMDYLAAEEAALFDGLK